ncbi:MAG: hypothetical protein IJ831_02715, partial [Spirochaetales bacterium]|nr:hypothetical protein [Spirochaetales bacterium]
GKNFSFDIRLTITDPVLASESDSNLLADSFFQYAKYYASLVASCSFDIRKGSRDGLPLKDDI